MLDADIFRELLFELGHLRPENITPISNNRFDRCIELVADALPLSAEVDELHVLPFFFVVGQHNMYCRSQWCSIAPSPGRRKMQRFNICFPNSSGSFSKQARRHVHHKMALNMAYSLPQPKRMP